jgi:general secretion pathway protein G
MTWSYKASMRQQRLGRQRAAGFTLIEILIALVLLAALASIAYPQVIKFLEKKSEVAVVQIESFKAALDFFRLDIGRYPTQEEGLGALVSAPPNQPRWNGPYLKSKLVPADPWGRPYVYRLPSRSGQAYDLLTLGADGVEGGSGENRDITAW